MRFSCSNSALTELLCLPLLNQTFQYSDLFAINLHLASVVHESVYQKFDDKRSKRTQKVVMKASEKSTLLLFDH